MNIKLIISTTTLLSPLLFLACSLDSSRNLSSDSQITTEEVDLTALQVGDIFKISPAKDPADCYLPGIFGLTRQVCGPYGLWKIRSHPKTNDSSNGGSYWKTIESLEDGSCLSISALNGITLARSITCDEEDKSQILTYSSASNSMINLDQLNNSASTSPLPQLTFFKERSGSFRKDDLKAGELTGSLDGVGERTYVHDERIPVIKEIAIVESNIVPGTISAIEIVHQDFTPGAGRPIIEIMGFCDINQAGHCDQIGTYRTTIENADGTGDQKYEYFTDLEVKYLNPDSSGPLAGVRAYHVNNNGDRDPAFEVNLIGGSLHPPTPFKSDFISEDAGDKSIKTMALCNEGTMLGIDCDGRYCDNTAIYCSKAISKSGEYWINHLVSDNNDKARNIKTTAECKEGEAITGLQCNSGSFCDNLKVRCGKIEGFDSNQASCSWTGAISEEQPNREGTWYKDNEQYLITGLKCLKGSYCDNKSLRVCNVASLDQKGGDWLSLAGGISSQSSNPALPLVGLSVRFTHPDMTRKTRSWLTKKQGYNRGYPKPTWTNKEVVSFGGYITGLAGIFAPFDASGFSGFANFQTYAAEIATSSIIQSQSQSIGIATTKETNEARNLLMGSQMFRFSNSFADHLPIYDKTGQQPSFPLLKTIELCGTNKASGSNHITGMVVKSGGEEPQIHYIGDTSNCNNDQGSQSISHTVDNSLYSISSAEWKPVNISGNQLIGGLKLNFSNGSSFELDTNPYKENCKWIVSGNPRGGGRKKVCNNTPEIKWQPAFRSIENYCINGFQGIAVTDQNIGGANTNQVRTYQGGSATKITLPSISQKVKNLGITGLAGLSPIYLAAEYCAR